jgi:hypothetical protein
MHFGLPTDQQQNLQFKCNQTTNNSCDNRNNAKLIILSHQQHQSRKLLNRLGKTTNTTIATPHTQFLVVLWILLLMVGTTALPPVIRIGAIFTEDQKDSSDELAFKYAVYKINKDKTILPKTTLVYDIQYVPKDDSFRTSKKGEFNYNINFYTQISQI